MQYLTSKAGRRWTARDRPPGPAPRRPPVPGLHPHGRQGCTGQSSKYVMSSLHYVMSSIHRTRISASGPATLLLATSLAVPAPASRPAPPRVRPTRPSPSPASPAPVELDGVVDEAAWEAITPFPLTLYTPTFGGPLTEATEIRIGHDDRYLYVSGRMYDSEPDRIRTGTYYRDSYSGDDILAVVIDSYNDFETAVWFVTNPEGVRQDRTVFQRRAVHHRHAHELGLERPLGRGHLEGRAGLVRRVQDPVLDPRLPGGRRRGHHGSDRLPADPPQERAPDLPGHGPLLGPARLRQTVARPAGGSQGRASGHAAVRHPLRPGRSPADAGRRTLRRRGPGVERRTRPDHRGRTRRQVLADLQPRARPDRQHRLRAGRGGRAADQPDALLALLPREAPVLPGTRVDLRLQHRRLLQPPLPQSPDRAGRRRTRAHLRGRARRRTAGRHRLRPAEHADRGPRQTSLREHERAAPQAAGLQPVLVGGRDADHAAGDQGARREGSAE